MDITTGNPQIDRYIGLAGTGVTMASFLASALNSRVRSALDAEGEVPALFLWLALLLNYAAMNLDKAAQMHKLLRGQAVTVVKVTPVSATAPTPPPGA